MIATELLEILRCPETMQRLRVATPSELSSFARGTRVGVPVEIALEQGLIREDGKVLYPIRNGIPVMLLEEALGID